MCDSESRCKRNPYLCLSKHKLQLFTVMRKLIWACALILSAMIVGSCSVETDDDSYATVTYWGECDSIVFTDSCDTVFGKYIYRVITSKKVPLVGDSSLFQEKGKANQSDPSAAISVCNLQAIKTYDNMLATATSSHLRSELAIAVGDTLDIDSLDAFKIYYGLYGFVNSSSQWVASYQKYYY